MDEALQKPDESEPIGYGNPPRHSRFKKGQSGNPSGRRHLKTGTLREALAYLLDAEMDAKLGTNMMDHIALALVNKARSGNPAAVALLLKEFE